MYLYVLTCESILLCVVVLVGIVEAVHEATHAVAAVLLAEGGSHTPGLGLVPIPVPPGPPGTSGPVLVPTPQGVAPALPDALIPLLPGMDRTHQTIARKALLLMGEAPALVTGGLVLGPLAMMTSY